MNFELHTKRLRLRPMKPEDAEGMYELNLPEDVFHNTGDKPFGSIEEAESFILHYDQFAKYKMGRFSIIDILSNSYVGWCGLKFTETTNEVDLGYRILPHYRGKGLAREAAEINLEYGFKNLSLNTIIGRATKENHASIAILQKLGMLFEKEFIAHSTVCVQYTMSLHDWLVPKDHINANTKLRQNH